MTSSHRIRRALWLAAGYLLLTEAIQLLARHGLDAAMAVRLNGLLMGAWVVVWGNAIPKMLAPLDRLTCAAAREQALRRFAGWALVLGGLADMLAFALAPIATAPLLATCLLAPPVVATGIVVARCAWRRHRARRGDRAA